MKRFTRPWIVGIWFCAAAHLFAQDTPLIPKAADNAGESSPFPSPAMTEESMPRVGIVDVYGARRISESRIREALRIKEGDLLPADRTKIEERVAAIPGVLQAHLGGVCCDEAGKMILFVGVAEAGAKRVKFHPAPRGAIRLPDEIIQVGRSLDQTLMTAVQRGDAADDQSQGHSLAGNADARALQERYLQFAAHDSRLLRKVLRNSGDAEHRARAAEVMAYAIDKQSVVGDLVRATRDPSAGVRNHAIRALALFAAYSQRKPELRLRVPWAPFVDLLNSAVWTDLNKSSFALMQLSEGRDPRLMRELRAGALPALLEMAQWKSRGHAMPAFVILGRIGGMTDEAVFKAWQDGRTQAVLDLFAKPS